MVATGETTTTSASEKTTEPQTTTSLTTSTSAPHTTTPCVDTLENRTSVSLDEDCGPHGVKGYCTTENAACMPQAGSVDWKCRCIPGYLKKGSTCKSVPRQIFKERKKAITINSSLAVGDEVLTLQLDGIKDICVRIPVFIILTNENNPFSIQTQGCDAAKITLKDKLPSNDKDLNFMLFAEAELDTGIFVNDAIVIKTQINQEALPRNTVIAIPDGTFAGHVMMTLNDNYFSQGDQLSLSDDYFSVDNFGRISTTRDLFLSNIQNDITLLYSVSFDVYRKDSKSAIVEKIFSVTVVIIRLKFSVDITEGGSQNTRIARIEMKGTAFNITSEDIQINIFRLTQSGLTVDETLIDYDLGQKQYSFTLKTDLIGIPDKTFSTSIYVNVRDSNDNPPQFVGDGESFSISKTTIRNVIVGVISATDVDTETLVYSVDKNQDDFSIDEKGIIRTIKVTKDIKFNQINDQKLYSGNYTLRVYVSDGQTSVWKDVYIYLVNSPQIILNKRFENSVFENTSIGSVVANVSVLGYREFQFAASERANNYFILNRQTGLVTLRKELDREKNPGDKVAFSVLALTVDGDVCSLTLLGELVVIILDVNDNPPAFTYMGNYTGNVIENESRKVIELNVPIVTTDADINSTVGYSLTNDYGVFAIHPNDAAIETTSGLDREMKEEYQLEVVASDGVYSAKRGVTITVQDVNDNAPVFTNAMYSTSALESSSVGSGIMQIQATDADINENAEIIYSLEGGDGKFQINSKSGTISLTDSLDREIATKHVITVFALNREYSNSTEVIVNVIDVNDNAPVFVQDSLSITIKENISCDPNTPFMKVEATDKDVGINAVVAYDIVNATIPILVNASGHIFCQNDFDFEQQEDYTFGILAKDGGNPVKRLSSFVVITIEDINDNAPVISPINNITLKRSEFSSTKPIAVVYATDQDSGLNAQLTYIIHSNSLGLSIRDRVIWGSDQQPNVGMYSIVVKVTDGGNPSNSASLEFSVEIIADTVAGVTFSEKEVKFEIKENNQLNAFVGDLSNKVTSNGATLKFKIVQISDFFAIDVDTGRVTAKVSLDREAIDEGNDYLFVVKAYDVSNDKNNDLVLVTVKVNDENDNEPVLENAVNNAYIMAMSEQEEIGYGLQMVKATDKDEDTKLQFSIIGSLNYDCHRDFGFKDGTGQLILVKKLDYESYKFCKFSIQVDDGKHFVNASADVNVFDYNDNSPEFVDVGILTVKEDIQQHEWVQLTTGFIVDKDSRNNADIKLRITTDDDCPFEIERRNENGRTLMAFSITEPLDYERRTTYSCDVTAEDKGSPSRSSNTQVLINVMDVNDNDPEIDDSSIKSPIEVSRDASQYYVILQNITATDRDTDKHIVFSLEFSDDESKDYFAIDPTTGKLEVIKRLTSLQKDKVVMKIYATDSGLPKKRSSFIQIEVVIKDDNVRPWFVKSSYMVEVLEENEITGAIFSAKAWDIRGSETVACNCTYRLQPQSDVFEIDALKGDIRMRSGRYLNREGEAGPTLSLSVIATDNAETPKDSDPVTLEIKILDINDNIPIFRKDYSGHLFEIPQMAAVSTVIGSVKAEDKDEGDNSITKYSIFRAVFSSTVLLSDVNETKFNKHIIAINETTGEMSTNGSLNLNESRDFYIMVTVQARDMKIPEFTDAVQIIIRVLFDNPNKYPPRFVNAKYTKSIQRDHKTTENVMRVVAKDNDTSAPNNQILYSIAKGNVRDIFTIDKDTGGIALAFLIDETIRTDSITLIIQATDKGIIPRSSTCEVEISITGKIDECIPQSVATEQQAQITADRNLFMVVMIVVIVALCFFIILSAVLCFKYRTAGNVHKNADEYITKEYDTLHKLNKEPDFSHSYTTFEQNPIQDDGYEQAAGITRESVPDNKFASPVSQDDRDLPQLPTSTQAFLNRGYEN